MDLYPLMDTFHNKCGSQSEGTGLTRTLILDLVLVPFLTTVMLQMKNWEGHPFCRYHFEQLSNHITKVGFLFMITSVLEQESTHTGIYSLAWASQEEQFIVVK